MYRVVEILNVYVALFENVYLEEFHGYNHHINKWYDRNITGNGHLARTPNVSHRTPPSRFKLMLLSHDLTTRTYIVSALHLPSHQVLVLPKVPKSSLSFGIHWARSTMVKKGKSKQQNSNGKKNPPRDSRRTKGKKHHKNSNWKAGSNDAVRQALEAGKPVAPLQVSEQLSIS
jgi:hypothetical protein